MKLKFVFDTNALISAALLRKSTNAIALNHALNIGRIVISEPTLQEFTTVIFRKKFDKYFLTETERLEAITRVEKNALFYFPAISINECRDPKDNKFLELALASSASCIITGDQDLLTLHPFKSTSILSATDFLLSF